MRMRMKKLLSILLVTAMLASMAVTAFADAPAASNFDGDIMVAAVTDIGITEDTSTAFTKGTDGNEGKWVGTATVTNATDAEEANVTFTGIVTDSEDTKVDDATVEVTLQATQPTAIDVPADGCTLDVVVEFTGTPAVGEYKVKLHTGTENEAVQVGTINIEEETKTATVASVAPVAEDGSYTATHSNGTISFTATDFAKNGTVGVKITLAGDVADNAECTYQIDSGKAETATLGGKVLTIEGIAVGEEKTSKTLKVTPVGCEAIELTLNFDGINFVVDPAPEGNVTPAKNVKFEFAEGKYTGTVTLTNSAANESTVEVNGKVKNAEGTEVGTVVVAEADQKTSITVPGTKAGAGKNTKDVTVSFDAPTAAGTYNVSLIIAGKETTVGTITVAKDPETDMPTISATLGETVEVGTPLSGGSVVLGKLEAATGYKLTAAVTKDGAAYNNLTINAAGDQNNIAGAGYTFTTTDAGEKTISLADINFTEKGTYKIKFTVVKTNDAEVTATSEEKTVTVTKQIDESVVNAVLEVGEAENGVATGTLTLKNPTQESVDLIPNVTVSAGATIEIAEDAGWKNNEAVTLDGTTVTEKVLTFKVKCPTDKADAVTYTVNATVTKDAAPIEGMPDAATVTIPGNGGTVDPTPNPDPNPGDNGSSNSGSSSSGSSNSTPANAPSANVGAGGAVSAAKISGDAKKAVSNAKNGKANVNVTNAKTVGTAALNNMAKAAAKEDVALTMTAKTTDKNGVVVASLKFDATKAAEAVAKAGTKEVKLGVELNTKNTKNVTSLFKKWFKNKNITVVKMAQKGEFGFTVEAAVKVDLKNFNKNNLKFYSYNAATNTYKEIVNANPTIDAKGLVHFTTTVGNYIIITDAPIASK